MHKKTKATQGYKFIFTNKQEGQSLVEFALVLPILLALVLGIVQFGIILNAQVAVTSASREGARIAAFGDLEQVGERVKSAAEGTLLLNYDDLVVTLEPPNPSSGQPVTVTVRGEVGIIVPNIFLLNFADSTFPVSSSSTMKYEG